MFSRVAPRRGLQFVAPDALQQVGALLDSRRRDGVLSAQRKTSEAKQLVHCTFATIRRLVLDDLGLGRLTDHEFANVPQSMRVRKAKLGKPHLTADPTTKAPMLRVHRAHFDP